MKHDYFSPSTEGLYKQSEYYRLGGRSNMVCKQNPTPSELKAGIYRPRLTVTKRLNKQHQFEITMKIEFSVPKLLYGNNFDELTDSDFPAVVDKLEVVLKTMGVRIFHALVLNAPVSAVHYSKNIPLTDGTTPHYLISKIKQANISLALDVNQTDYRNEGYSYKWHANTYEVAFYDKLKDLEAAKTSEKRAIEKDSTLQLHLFDELRNKRTEVLRMEARLNNRQKIKQLFKSLRIEQPLTFSGLFNNEVSKKVLIYYMSEVERQRPTMLDYLTTNPQTLLSDIILNNPKLGTLKALQTFGLKQALDSTTPRELRTMLGKYNQRNWYRLIADAKKIKLPVIMNPLNIINKHLVGFEPLRLVDFQDKMINNVKYD